MPNFNYDDYKVAVPVGVSGSFEVRHFEIDEPGAGLNNLRAAINHTRDRVLPGTYTELRDGGLLWMSDTHDEIRDHMEPIRRAEHWQGNERARVLINGLGLGMVLGGMLRSGNLGEVTVVERSPDVIALVGPYYETMAAEHGTCLRIVEADSLTWKAARGERYDLAWHDIWAHISADNVETMGTLHRKYGQRARWQGSWKREHVLYLRRSGAWR